MKRLLLLVLLLAVVHRESAQTNAALPQTDADGGETNTVARLTDIHSDHGSFDFVNYRSIYLGHVRVNDPKMKLTSDWLAADAPHGTNSDRHVVATTNVVMDLAGGTNQSWHVTCDDAVYDFKMMDAVTNETVTLSGHAKAESDKYIVTGEPLIYDMQNHLFSGTKYTTIFKQAPALPGSTNAPGSKTNASSAPSFF